MSDELTDDEIRYAAQQIAWQQPIENDHIAKKVEATLRMVPVLRARLAKLQEQIDGKPMPTNTVKEPVPEDAFAVEKAHVQAVTKQAVKFVAPGYPPTWLPLEAVHDDSEVYLAGDSGTLLVKRWFAESRGWAKG